VSLSTCLRQTSLSIGGAEGNRHFNTARAVPLSYRKRVVFSSVTVANPKRLPQHTAVSVIESILIFDRCVEGKASTRSGISQLPVAISLAYESGQQIRNRWVEGVGHEELPQDGRWTKYVLPRVGFLSPAQGVGPSSLRHDHWNGNRPERGPEFRAPRSQLWIRNKGVSLSTMSNDSGYYTASNLTPGDYKLTVEAKASRLSSRRICL